MRHYINAVASEMDVIDIFGAGKQKLQAESERRIREELEAKGFEFDSLSFIGELRVDPQNKNRINAVLAQQQAALEAEQKVKEVEAVARQVEAQAAAQRAKADANAYEVEKAAAAKAKAILLEAEAQAKANVEIAKSLTTELIRLRQIEKWEGAVPTMMMGDGQVIPIIGNLK